MADTRATNSSAKAGYTASCTYRRSIETHSCPEFEKHARTAISAARRTSASALMIIAFLPPSSSEQPMSRSPQRAAISRPTRVDPVNIT